MSLLDFKYLFEENEKRKAKEIKNGIKYCKACGRKCRSTELRCKNGVKYFEELSPNRI